MAPFVLPPYRPQQKGERRIGVSIEPVITEHAEPLLKLLGKTKEQAIAEVKKVHHSTGQHHMPAPGDPGFGREP